MHTIQYSRTSDFLTACSNLCETVPIIKSFPFSSTKKRMNTIVQAGEGEGDSAKRRMYSKGASEVMLQLCSSYMDQDGSIKKLTPELRARVVQYISVRRTAAHCSALQHSAKLCNTLQARVAQYVLMRRTAAHCLQHLATLRNTLQHFATLCNTLDGETHC